MPGSICNAQKYGYNISAGLSKIVIINSHEWNPGGIVTLNGFYHKNSKLTFGIGISYSYMNAAEISGSDIQPMAYYSRCGLTYVTRKNSYTLIENTPFMRVKLFNRIAGNSDVFLHLGFSYIYALGKLNFRYSNDDPSGEEYYLTQKFIHPGFVFGLGIIHGRRSGFNFEIMPQFKYIFSGDDNTQIFTLNFGISM